MIRLPVIGALKMFKCGVYDILSNRLTGECVKLGADDRKVDLQFAPNGMGILVSTEGHAPRWANSVLRYVALGDSVAKVPVRIHVKQTCTETPIDELAQHPDVRCFSHSVDEFTYASYVISYKYRSSPCSFVWWPLPHLFDKLFGTFPTKLVCTRLPTWEATMRLSGLSPDHLQPSWKAASSRAASNGSTVDENTFLKLSSEYTVSTPGFISLLFGLPQKRIATQHNGVGVLCKCIFKVVTDFFHTHC